MTEERVQQLLREAKFTFAKTMPKHPHEYTLRKNWAKSEDFTEVAQFIFKHGKHEKFYTKTFPCYYFDGHKYWNIDIDRHDLPFNMIPIINRAKV